MKTRRETKHLSETENEIYRCILSDKKRILNMTIRDIAKELHVSSSTIVRTASKLGFNGFAELKYALKTEAETQKMIKDTLYSKDKISTLLPEMPEDSNSAMLQAVNFIVNAPMVVFFGIGRSGILSEYAARYFGELGKCTFYIKDPFVQIPDKFGKDFLIFVLSVSGETTEVIDRVKRLKQNQSTIVLITADRTSTLAKLADVTVSYLRKDKRLKCVSDEYIDISSSVPMLTIIEYLGNMALN
jgi:DNA-binding MurR/RpiR family transcriptional regulator